MMRKESREKIDDDIRKAKRWLDEIAYNPPLTWQEYDRLIQQWDDTLQFTRMQWYDRMERDATSTFKVGIGVGIFAATILWMLVWTAIWTTM